MHHLHVWKLDDEHIHLEAHINIKENLPVSEVQAVRLQIEEMMWEKYGISHITLQTEYKGCYGNNELINTATKKTIQQHKIQ